jgi:gliding motility-associated-like protein
MTGANVTCYGLSNGSATVLVTSGGSGNYTYTWATSPAPTITSGGTSSSISNLPAGAYSVSVRDNVSGCTVTASYVVTTPDPLNISGIVTDVNCFGQATGAVNATITGGKAPYIYSWSNSATTQDISSQISGAYVLTVNAPAGCSATRTFTITQPLEALDAVANVTNVSCFNTSTGSIDMTIFGGTAPYFYSWDSGQTSQDINNVPSGNYNLTVTDSKGCTILRPFTITSPTQLSGSFTTIDAVICYGDPTGNLVYEGTGGTTQYSYSWQNSTTLFSESTGSLSNVIADDYQVTVTDAKGCTHVDFATITSPTELVGSTIGTNVLCYGGTDGAIDATISGGVAPYFVLWENSVPNTIGTTEDLVNIPAEIYTATIQDLNSCPLTLVQIITQPDSPLSATTTQVDVLCYGDNTGSVDITVVGGTTPYTYSWSNSQSTEDIQDLLFGSYTVDVLDFNLCPLTESVLITQPLQPLTVTNIITHVNCFDESNGGINLTVTGGTTPYEYIWTNSTYSLSTVTQDIADRPADTYAYLVTDFNACFSGDTLEVTQPTLLVGDVTGVNILCHAGNNGSVDLTISGGTIPYTYVWNNGPITQDQNNLYAGFYEVTSTDDHGCIEIDTITLTEPLDSLAFSYIVTDVRCNDGTDGEIDLTITGGTVPYNYLWSNGDTVAVATNLTSGMYEFNIVDENGCLLSDSIFVDQPDPLVLNENITPVTCFGLGDGIINITPTGGTAPYHYKWFNSDFALSAQTEDLVDFHADMYQLEVTDTANCFYEIFLEITEPDILLIEQTYNIVSCFEGSDGNIFVDISGGNPVYNTTWSNGATTEDLLNIPSDFYTLVVVDQKNCTDSILVDMSQPNAVEIDFTFDEVTCIDQFNGIAYATPYGGNGGYFYEWSNGETSPVAEDLANQWYSLFVTDVLGCTGTDSLFITKDPTGCIHPVNAFSPNEDLYNDTWIIDNMHLYPDAELQVFNKWGNVIHTQTGIYEAWDGSVNGKQVPSELYYWIINLNSPEREVLKGNITIIR